VATSGAPQAIASIAGREEDVLLPGRMPQPVVAPLD
jgi:hypothetical protein